MVYINSIEQANKKGGKVELVEVKKNEVFCDSSMVARKFGMKHLYVARMIRQLIGDLEKVKEVTKLPKYFTEERIYRGHKYTAYLMDRVFFSMLVMRFRGKKAMLWQLKFIEAFDSMEKRILLADQNANDTLWLTQRKQGKIARREETDVIKDFVDYATSQGSKHAKFYYKHITNSAYRALGLMVQSKPKLRDTMNLYEVSELLLAERLAKNSLKKYMGLERNYKDIYENVKDDLQKYGAILRIE